MRPVTFKIFFSAAILFPLSCTDLGTPPSPEPTALIPLAVGNHWEYVDSMFFRTDSVHVYTESCSVANLHTIFWNRDSVAVYDFRITISFPDGSAEGGGGDYKNTADGLFLYALNSFDTTGQHDYKSLLLKYPLQVGDTWERFDFDVTFLRRCMSTDTVIVTPFRRFHCYQIRELWESGGYRDEFYSDNFGLVAVYQHESAITLTSTLVSFLVQ